MTCSACPAESGLRRAARAHECADSRGWRGLCHGPVTSLHHPDHAEITEWLDGYDPEELEVFPIQVALGRIAARRNAAAKRIIKPAND